MGERPLPAALGSGVAGLWGRWPTGLQQVQLLQVCLAPATRLHPPECTAPSPSATKPWCPPCSWPGDPLPRLRSRVRGPLRWREAGKGPSLPLLCHLPRPSLLPVFWVPLCAWGYLSNGQKPFLGLGAQASSWGVTPKEISDRQAQVPPGLPLSTSTSVSLAGVVRSICSVQAALSWSRVSWVAPGSGFPLSVSTSTSVALRLFPRRAGTPPPSWLPFCLSVSGCLIWSLFLPLLLHS